MTLLFDSNRWNRPLRYIKNNRLEKAVRNEMSQYFFDTCQSDGKLRISFSYLSSLSIFGKMVKRKISWSTIEKTHSNQFDNYWVFSNNINIKGNNINKEFRNRIETLDKESLFLDILETRTRLYNDDTKTEYFPKMYDPFLNGTYRGVTMKKGGSPYKLTIENLRETLGINRVYAILFPDPDSQELKQKPDAFYFDKKQFVFNAVGPHTNDQKIPKDKESIGLKEISKKVPRWSYKLITDLEQQSGEYPENIPVQHQIRSRKAKRVVIFTANKENPDSNTNNKDTNPTDPRNEVALPRYSQQSDFRRGIIKGSMRAQRRKIVIWELFQANAPSPLFLDRIKRNSWFSFDISEIIKVIFTNCTGKGVQSESVEYIDEETKKKRKQKRRKQKKRTNTNRDSGSMGYHSICTSNKGLHVNNSIYS